MDLKKYVKDLSTKLKEGKKLASPNNDTPNEIINNSIASIMLTLAKTLDKLVLNQEILESNCPYCHEEGKELPSGKGEHVSIVKTHKSYMLSIFFEGEHLEDMQGAMHTALVPIRHCPVCGRELVLPHE